MIFIFRRTSLIMKNTRRKIIKGEKSSDPGNSIDFLFKWNHTQISNVKFVKKYLQKFKAKTDTSRLFMKDKVIANVIVVENPSQNQHL